MNGKSTHQKKIVKSDSPEVEENAKNERYADVLFRFKEEMKKS